MLYLTQNTDTLIVTNVQELATSNNYLLVLTREQIGATDNKSYPTITTENKRYVSFTINTTLDCGEYKYSFYDGDGVNLEGDFELLETGILKIEE